MSRESYKDWKKDKFCTNCGRKLIYVLQTNESISYDARTGKKLMEGRTVRYCPNNSRFNSCINGAYPHHYVGGWKL